MFLHKVENLNVDRSYVLKSTENKAQELLKM
jgi:hypothetical protein